LQFSNNKNKMKREILLEIDEKELYFMNVPERFKNFVIKNYGYAGLWLMETDSKELNHWKDSLPKGYKYEILGFTNDVIVGEIPTDKNFVLRRVSA
jgi:hypothetical protein